MKKNWNVLDLIITVNKNKEYAIKQIEGKIIHTRLRVVTALKSLHKKKGFRIKFHNLQGNRISGLVASIYHKNSIIKNKIVASVRVRVNEQNQIKVIFDIPNDINEVSVVMETEDSLDTFNVLLANYLAGFVD